MDKSKCVGRIIPGSKSSFKIYLTDENDDPINIPAAYTSGNLYFQNDAGVIFEKALTVTGNDPQRGILNVALTNTDTADADDSWKDADLELISSGVSTFVPLENQFEIIEKNVIAP